MKTDYEVLLALLRSRKTTYDFTDKKVSNSELNKILESVRWAPSTRNTRPWSFVVVKDKKVIDQLMHTCYYGDFKTFPDIIIAIVTEPMKVEVQDLARRGFRDFVGSHKYINIGVVIPNIILSAQSLGIGSCIISPVVREANKVLNVPARKETIILVGLGYGSKPHSDKKRYKKPVQELIHKDKY